MTRQIQKQTVSIAALAFMSAAWFAGPVHAEDAKPWNVVGSDRMHAVVLEGDTPLFRIEDTRFGTNWRYIRYTGRPVAENGVRVYEEKVGLWLPFKEAPERTLYDFRYELAQSDSNTFVWRYRFTPEGEPYAFGRPGTAQAPGAGVGPLIAHAPFFDGAKCSIGFAEGEEEVLPMPPPQWGKGGVKTLTFRTANGRDIRFEFAPPAFVHCDHAEVRIMLDSGKPVPVSETFEAQVTMTLPEKAGFEPANRWVNTSDWIVYPADDDFAPGSVIGVEGWLHKPAGKHGWLKIDGDDFKFEDGTPVKFVGGGIQFSQMARPYEESDMWNDKWAKHGINLVRLHKFINHGWAGVLSPDHMVPDSDKIDKFDYYHASARKRGVYLAWSGVFHMRVNEQDRDRIKHFDEIASDPEFRRRPEWGVNVYGLKNIAPDIQDLLIAQTLMMLKRKNEYTRLHYYEDPALAYIELHNEDDIFFPGDNFQKLETRFPKYFADFQARFNDYLKDKYKTQEAVEKAWGNSYPRGQQLGDLRPDYPGWAMNAGAHITPRIVDTLYFMYLEQSGFYTRFAQAIRDTGYGGAIVGGCWQASTFLGHLCNTLTDYEVGFIDRHNYSGTPLDRPGAGTMSAAFQQVRHRPFNFSEWGGGSVAVPTVLIYGMGLQGWDASCQFCSSNPGIINRRNRGVNDSHDDFIQIGQYPALARMIYRGDVKEGDIVGNRLVSIPGLFKGDVGFEEQFSLLGGGANQKEFSSVIPQAALMAGRVVIEFLDAPVPENPIINKVGDLIDEEDRVVRSNTGQLMWDYSGQGYYTADTPGTKAVIGYVTGRKLELGAVILKTPAICPVKLYVNSLDEEAPVETADRLLITTFARAMSSGAVFDDLSERPLEPGGEPLLIEPVVVDVTLKRKGKARVYALDLDGKKEPGMSRIGVKKTRDALSFTLDGAKSKTVYYVVEF